MKRNDSVHGDSTAGPAGRQRSSGFTLMELILVLAIIGIVLSVIGPTFRGFIQGQDSQNAANRLLALARHGRAQAISEGRTYRLNVDETKGTYWLDAVGGADFADTGTDFSQRFQLPEGMKARWMSETNNATAQSSQAAVTGQAVQPVVPGVQKQETQAVLFYSDGRCETTTLKLTDRNGLELELAAPSETENWRLAKEGQP